MVIPFEKRRGLVAVELAVNAVALVQLSDEAG